MSWRIRCAALRGMSVARARSRMPHSPDSAKASRTRTQRAIGPLGEPAAIGGRGGTVSTVAGIAGPLEVRAIDPVGLRMAQ